MGLGIPAGAPAAGHASHWASVTMTASSPFLSGKALPVPALQELEALNQEVSVRMEIITKAKRSCTAFEEPGPRKPGRGRPPKKGAAIHLKELFSLRRNQFQETEIELYGKKKSVRWYSIDLLWGQELYQELRFVLVGYNGKQSILASTSLSLDPLAVIRLYSYRFRIECTFRELKQQTGAFCYRFWSEYMPKLDYYQKKGVTAPIARIENEKARKKIRGAVRAVEMHMVLSCIAMGTLQILTLHLTGRITSSHLHYQRTPY